jgi:hypothetical protein
MSISNNIIRCSMTKNKRLKKQMNNILAKIVDFEFFHSQMMIGQSPVCN